MNRRDFLAAGFKLGAAGLLLPFIEPARKVWALDRTMAPRPIHTTGPNCFPGKVVIGDYNLIYVDNSAYFHTHDLIWVGGEPMLVVAKDTQTHSLSVIRNFGVTPQV